MKNKEVGRRKAVNVRRVTPIEGGGELISYRRRQIIEMECSACGHTYERSGLDGVFREMFDGCPACGNGTTEEY